MGREAKAGGAVQYLALTEAEVQECRRKAMAKEGEPIVQKYPGAEGTVHAKLVKRVCTARPSVNPRSPMYLMVLDRTEIRGEPFVRLGYYRLRKTAAGLVMNWGSQTTYHSTLSDFRELVRESGVLDQGDSAG